MGCEPRYSKPLNYALISPSLVSLIEAHQDPPEAELRKRISKLEARVKYLEARADQSFIQIPTKREVARYGQITNNINQKTKICQI